MAKRKGKSVGRASVASGLGRPWSPKGSVGSVTKAPVQGGPTAPQPK